MKFNEAMIIYRKRSMLTQKQLAKKLGSCTTTINKYETGKSSPTMAKAAVIANTLGFTLAEVTE